MPQSSSNPSTSLITAQQLQLESERMQEVVLLVDNMLRQEETILGIIIDCMYDIGSVRLIDKKLPLPFLRGATRRVARVSKPLFRMLALRWIKKNCPELLAKWLYSKVLFEDEPKPAPKPETEPAFSVQAALENPNPVEEISEQVSSPPPLPNPVETAIETGEVPPITSGDLQNRSTEDIPAIAAPADDQAFAREDRPSISAPTHTQALVPIASTSTAPLPIPTITLEEYNRAIAQLQFRDTEITKLRTRSYLLTGLLVAVSVALGGALVWPLYNPELGIPSQAEPVQSQGVATP